MVFIENKEIKVFGHKFIIRSNKPLTKEQMDEWAMDMVKIIGDSKWEEENG